MNPFSGSSNEGTNKDTVKERESEITTKTVTIESQNDDYPLYMEGMRLLSALKPLLLGPNHEEIVDALKAPSANS